MDILGGNGNLLDANGQKIGRVHGVEATTFEGAKKYKGGAETLVTGMLDFGNDNLLFAHCRASDDPRSNPCAIVGGTGDFRGARGYGVEKFPALKEDSQSQIVEVDIEFIP